MDHLRLRRRDRRTRRLLPFTIRLNAARAALAAAVFFPVDGPHSVRPPRRPRKVFPAIRIVVTLQSDAFDPDLWNVTRCPPRRTLTAVFMLFSFAVRRRRY